MLRVCESNWSSESVQLSMHVNAIGLMLHESLGAQEHNRTTAAANYISFPRFTITHTSWWILDEESWTFQEHWARSSGHWGDQVRSKMDAYDRTFTAKIFRLLNFRDPFLYFEPTFWNEHSRAGGLFIFQQQGRQWQWMDTVCNSIYRDPLHIWSTDIVEPLVHFRFRSACVPWLPSYSELTWGGRY